MIIVGIDPGIRKGTPGAFAVLRRSRLDRDDSDQVIDMPVVEVAAGRKSHRELDYGAVAALAQSLVEETYPESPPVVVIESQLYAADPRVRTGSRGLFVQGEQMGALRMAWVATGIEPTFVHPAKWKAAMLKGYPSEDPKAKKAASLDLARKLFPTCDLGLKKHHGRAEALLIAEFGLGLYRIGLLEAITTRRTQ